MKRKPKPKRRSQIEATLAKFEAMDPDELDSDQRRFRSLAIKALKIELLLRAQGLIGEDGSLKPVPVRPDRRSSPQARHRRARRAGRDRPA